MGNTLSNSAIRHTDWLVITGASLFIVWLVLRSRSRATQVRGPPRSAPTTIALSLLAESLLQGELPLRTRQATAGCRRRGSRYSGRLDREIWHGLQQARPTGRRRDCYRGPEGDHAYLLGLRGKVLDCVVNIIANRAPRPSTAPRSFAGARSANLYVETTVSVGS
jgi:hypothetical protein